MIKVLLVDDHKMVIEGLQLILQNQDSIMVVGHALNGHEALQLAKRCRPAVVLMDINMPELNGIDTTKKMLELLPEIKIIALSMHKEVSLIKLMLASGAKGYVLKNAGQEEVIKAIQTVYDGDIYLDKMVHEVVMESLVKPIKAKKNITLPKLSRREKEVLKCIMEEKTTQEIADILFISFGTVETHRRNMLIKTGARNTVGLVKMALEYNLLER